MSREEGSGPPIGQLLRERREAKGLSLEEAAACTKIKIAFLKAIEEGDYRLLPDELYLIRFLFEYAAFLGLDPEAITAQFKQQIQHQEGRGLFQWVPPKSYTLPLRKILLSLVFLLIAIPIVFILSSLLSQRIEEVSRVRPPKAERPQQIQAIPPSPAPPLSVSPEQEAPGPSSGHVLTIKANQLTWMIAAVDDKEHDVLLRPGDVVRWTARERLVLTVGNAGGVELFLDGSPLPPLGSSGQVVRNVVLLEGGERLPRDLPEPERAFAP